MHIKFLVHGTGSAGKAAGYLLGERDAAGKPREGVEVLRVVLSSSARSSRRMGIAPTLAQGVIH